MERPAKVVILSRTTINAGRVAKQEWLEESINSAFVRGGDAQLVTDG